MLTRVHNTGQRALDWLDLGPVSDGVWGPIGSRGIPRTGRHSKGRTPDISGMRGENPAYVAPVDRKKPV